MGFWSTMGNIFTPENIGTGLGAAFGPGGAAVGAGLGRAAGGVVSNIIAGDSPVGGVINDAAVGYGQGAGIESLQGAFAKSGAEAVVPQAGAGMMAPAPTGVADYAGMEMGGYEAPVDSRSMSMGGGESQGGRMAAPGMTTLEKAFLISQIAGMAGSIYGGVQAGQRRDEAGDMFGNVMFGGVGTGARDYGSVRRYGSR